MMVRTKSPYRSEAGRTTAKRGPYPIQPRLKISRRDAEDAETGRARSVTTAIFGKTTEYTEYAAEGVTRDQQKPDTGGAAAPDGRDALRRDRDAYHTS